MKRVRVNSPVAESSAGAARRVCTREEDAAHRDGDTTFFFIRLPNGKTITADMPLNSTVEELVQYLEHKVGRIKARHCLVVGKHTAQLGETLYAAGVSRDCTVQIQLTRVQTPYDCYNQQHDSIRQLLVRLQQPLAEPAALVASLTSVVGWLVPSEGDGLWKTATEFKQAGHLATTAQDAVAACCTLGNHPKSSPADVQNAIAWLHMLIDWAYEGILYASQHQYSDIKDTLGVHYPVRQPRMECYEVARVVELWLMSSAAAMQVTLYSGKLREATGTHDVLETRLCKLTKVAGDVAHWLEEPIAPVTLLWLNSHVDCGLSGCSLPAASWCTNGRATLLYLKSKLGDARVTMMAALLQGMAAMWADHILSCYQHALQSLPGLINTLPAVAAINTSSRIPSIFRPMHTAAHRASETIAPSVSVLLSLLHASLLVNPVVQAYNKCLVAAGLHFEGIGLAHWYWGATATTNIADRMEQSIAESAMHRLLVGGETSEEDCERVLHADRTVLGPLEEPNNPFFGGSHRAVWDFMPLITAALDSLQAFADFASTHNITRHASWLPELLRTDAALLKLIQSWLLLGKLTATSPPPPAVHDGMTDSATQAAPAAQSANTATASYDGMVERVFNLLQQPLVRKWLEVKSCGLRPTTGPDEEAYVVMQALIHLVACCPRLAGAIPSTTRIRWLQEMLFPRHPTPMNDEDDDEDVTEQEIDIRRASILEDSYAELLSLSPSELRAGLRVQFSGEDAEGEGVFREWLVQLAGQLFSPMTALFECGATDLSVQHPSAAATIQTDWRKYFRLAGRVVGLSLRHGVPLGIQLSSAFYKALQSIEADSGNGLPHNNPWVTAATAANSSSSSKKRQQWEDWGAAADARGTMVVTLPQADSQAWRSGFRFVARPLRVQTNLEDLQQMDLQVSGSLKYILDNPCTADGLAINWTYAAPAVPGDVGDVKNEVELVPGGADLAVDEDNKRQFAEAMIEQKLLGGCKQQALWFYVGLCDIAEPKTLDLCQGRLLLPLTVRYFNSELCGSRSRLTVAGWQAATTVGSSLRGRRRQQLVEMFWEVVGDLDQQQRRQLLRFWTGILHLPASGFSGLGRKLQIVALTHTETAAAEAEAPAADAEAPAAEAEAPAADADAPAADADAPAADADAPAAEEGGQAAAENDQPTAAEDEQPAAAEDGQAAAAEDRQAAAAAEDEVAAATAEGAAAVDMDDDQPAATEAEQAAAELVQAAAERVQAAAELLQAAVEAERAAAEARQAAAVEAEQAAATAEGAAIVDMDHDQPAAAEGDQAQPAAAGAAIESGLDMATALADIGEQSEHEPDQPEENGLEAGALMAADADAAVAASASAGASTPNMMQVRALTRRLEAAARHIHAAEFEARAVGHRRTGDVRPAAVQTAVDSSNASSSSGSGDVDQRQPVVLQLPRAHTCFMQLLLPVGYQNAAEMRRALLVALENVDYFGRA